MKISISETNKSLMKVALVLRVYPRLSLKNTDKNKNTFNSVITNRNSSDIHEPDIFAKSILYGMYYVLIASCQNLKLH